MGRRLAHIRGHATFSAEKEITMDKLREKLAELEHDQWMAWAKEIQKSESINKERSDRWDDLFVSYDKLPEESKDQDREWADKVIKIVTDFLQGEIK